jgi:hypothetical protein
MARSGSVKLSRGFRRRLWRGGCPWRCCFVAPHTGGKTAGATSWPYGLEKRLRITGCATWKWNRRSECGVRLSVGGLAGESACPTPAARPPALPVGLTGLKNACGLPGARPGNRIAGVSVGSGFQPAAGLLPGACTDYEIFAGEKDLNGCNTQQSGKLRLSEIPTATSGAAAIYGFYSR